MKELVKGFKDFTGLEAIKRSEIRKIIEESFQTYGFEPAETPIVEYEDFVKSDNANDEAVSDIFKLQDRGKRKLALRYEFTFQLKRIMNNQKLPYKRYQIGPVFRDEPISANRLRQFTQCDVDIIGSKVKDEAELLSLVKNILDKLKIDFVIYVNNRKLLNEILDKEKITKKEEVIRELDKLDKLPENIMRKNLKKFKAEKLISIFKKPLSYFENYDSFNEIKELEKYCKYYGVKIKFLPNLARGLSYYNGSIFEIKTKKIKETICAGGSYNFNNTQSTGISFGLDRLSLISKIENKKNKVVIISLDKDKESINLVSKLRDNKIQSILSSQNISKSMDYANKINADYVIIIGEKEVKNKKYSLKNMSSGKQKNLSLSKIIKELS